MASGGKQTKYIFVVGGVMSGIGKGIAMAATGRILSNLGFTVTAVKIDPYINLDAGTMNPIEHGEVFVTDDGMECDQDIGNYERFLNKDILRDNYMTTGIVYQAVINRERNLDYEGKCVEVVPHIPEEVIRRIEWAGKKAKADFVLIEIGGTVGEYQNTIFLEAGRMLKLKRPDAVLFMLVSYLPVPRKIGEMKTKPTQHAVRLLNSFGIQPDIILARSDTSLDKLRKQKLSTFCNISPDSIISAPDIESIYEVPINFEREGLSRKILQQFGMRPRKVNGQQWKNFYRKTLHAKKTARIGIIGKYFTTGSFTLTDSYISVIEAIKHAAWQNDIKPHIEWINAEEIEHMKTPSFLAKYDGIIVPGGFGNRGIDGKIKAIKYIREHNIPFLGLCYGLQLAAVEFARNVCGLKRAHTTEIDPETPHPVIHTMPDQIEKIKTKTIGGTMRLGAYTCKLKRKTHSYRAYRESLISERHRHRYEVNNEYRDILEENGMVIAGINSSKDLVEIIELNDHPFFVGTQFHPEFKSRPLSPHPLFVAFIKATQKPKEK